MATHDKCCTIVPYFKVPDDKLELFKNFCEQFVARASKEPKCLYYGFSFHENQAHCREGYVDAEGLLAHLENVGALLEEALELLSSRGSKSTALGTNWRNCGNRLPS
jgi:quinol monooxygenase YgiN